MSMFAGMFVGAQSVGLIADRLGRRPGCLIALGLCAVFGLLSGAASGSYPALTPIVRRFDSSALLLELSHLIFYRFGVGLGVGSSPVGASLYTEILPPQRRYLCVKLIESTFFPRAMIAEGSRLWCNP